MTTIYQFKITLVDTPVWRRFRVYSDISLEDLHDTIQIVMGWENYHLYQFGIGYESYGGPNGHSARSSTLSNLMPRVGYRFGYEYDFGDQWLHELEFEKVLTKTTKPLPFCTAGRKACPPEDIGGIWNYHDLVLAMRQGRGGRYNRWRRELGERFDPNSFDRAEVNQQLTEYFDKQPQALFTGPRCQMCNKPISTQPGAGKQRLYCSSACKQAAYRKSKGANVQSRTDSHAAGNAQGDGIPICALPDCNEQAEVGKYGQWKMYCSYRHKEKAKRLRRAGKLDQPQALPTVAPMKLRKGKGVVHYAVAHRTTFCGRDASQMNEVSNAEGKVCQRCQKVRDEQTWWKVAVS